MDNGASSYRRFLDGDKSAFDEIVKEYFDSLTFFIDRYVHDFAAAEDIAIDAFSDLIVHRSRYNFKVTLKTYLFMIGRSRALNYLKRRNRLKTADFAEAEALASGQETPENALLAGERRRALDRALSALPKEMNAAVYLVYLEGLSYEEAAGVMKKSRKQVDNLLYRAKNALRAALGEEGELPE